MVSGFRSLVRNQTNNSGGTGSNPAMLMGVYRLTTNYNLACSVHTAILPLIKKN